jgi:uroporphyrinogen III methyltransferase/synthase
MIEEEAGSALFAPTIEIKAAGNIGPLQKAVDNLENYSHLIFTSVNGVKYFMQELNRQQLDLRALAGMKIMTIGSKTAAELKANGIRADFLPEDYSTSGILDYLRKLQSKGEINLKQASFLLPRADIAPKILEEELRNMGAKVKNVEAYKTEAVEMEVEILDLLKNDDLDLLTFTSSSTVDNFIIGLEKLIKSQNELLENDSKEIDQKKLWQRLKEIPAACIGPVTANQAKKYGLNVKITAAEYTIEGLFDEILKYYL